MNQLLKLSPLLFAMAFTACATPPGASAEPAEATICGLVHGRATLVGSLVKFRGVYKTDGRHYGFFIDYKCGKNGNSVDIGKGVGGESYDVLARRWQRECESRGDGGLCVVEKAVVVTGWLREAEGDLIVDVDSIHEE